MRILLRTMTDVHQGLTIPVQKDLLFSNDKLDETKGQVNQNWAIIVLVMDDSSNKVPNNSMLVRSSLFNSDE